MSFHNFRTSAQYRAGGSSDKKFVSGPDLSSLLVDLKAWYDFEPGFIATDSVSGGTNNLTDNSTTGTVQSVAGVGSTGGAAGFTAANTQMLSRASTPDLSLPGTSQDFTICAWVFFTNISDFRIIMVKGATIGVGSSEYELILQSGTGLRFFWGNLVSPVFATGTASPALNTWFFVVGWNDTGEGLAKIQVDNGTPDTVANAATIVGTDDFSIGRQTSGTGTPMDGRIDSVAKWNRVLTDEERTLLYNDGLGLQFSDL